MKTPNPNAETDPRFPSGKWAGFWTDKRVPGKHQMELILTFANGSMIGSGRDFVGSFNIDGAYQINDGLCVFVKQYVGKHAVGYRGFNEGKGIWGTWELSQQGIKVTGGFHIWPEGMPDPTQPVLEEEAEAPSEVDSDELLTV
jgi:hypothetical protein